VKQTVGPRPLASAHKCGYQRFGERVGPYLILLAEVLIFYRRVLFGAYAIPWDLRTFHLPLATFIADSFRAGEFPLWDPFTYCGRPFYANIQPGTGVLSPDSAGRSGEQPSGC
jgi:hypothetical protein